MEELITRFNKKDYKRLHLEDLGIDDEDWVTSKTMLKNEMYPEKYAKLRFYSLVNQKLTDSSLGGSISLNCPPQFTRFADVRIPGLLTRNEVTATSRSGNYGVGRYWGEAIDDNAKEVYMEFGVPEFNNILYYLVSAVDYRKAVIANSGRSAFFHDVGWMFGTGALIMAFPVIAPVLLAVKALYSIATSLLSLPGRFEHYFLKPTMHNYWATVNSIVTMIGNELGLIRQIVDEEEKNKKENKDKVNVPLKLDQEHLANIRKLMPDLVTDKNAINVHAIVSKAQRRKIMQLKNVDKFSLNVPEDYKIDYDSLQQDNEIPLEDKILKNIGNVSDIFKDINSTKTQYDLIYNNNLWDKLAKPMDEDILYKSIKKVDQQSHDNGEKESNLVDDFLDGVKSAFSFGGDDVKDKVKSDSKDTSDVAFDRKSRKYDDLSWVEKYFVTSQVMLEEGAKYAVFRVEETGSYTETFSNSTTSISIGDNINAASEKWKQIKFDFGAGHIPIISSAIQATTDALVGSLSGVTLGMSNVIGTFLAGASLNVRKRYSGSNVSFPAKSYKMTLVSPTPHPIAQLRNIYIPLAAILAAVLPKETGPRSYTAPYHCSLFTRGGERINLGMVGSVSITRGTSNLPFNKQRRPLAVEITFNVIDFDDVMSAPVPSSLLDLASVAYDDESGLNKYIQALCARDLFTATHTLKKAKLKASMYLQEAGLTMTPEYWSTLTGDLIPSFMQAFNDDKVVNYSEVF